MKITRIATYGLWLFVSVCMALILGELWLRWRSAYDNCQQFDPLLGISLKPNSKCVRKNRDFQVTYNINSFGLRENEFSLDELKDRLVILLLGDSFTEGAGVEFADTFGNKLEKKFNQDARLRKKVEVISAGVSGYSTVHEYLWLKSRGLVFAPQIVVLNINETDFVEAQKYHKIWAQNNYKNLINPPQTNESILSRLKILELLRNLVSSSFLSKSKVPQTTVFLLSANKEPEPGLLWQYVKSDIERINFTLKGRNIPLIVVFQPHGHQISKVEWPEGRKVHGFEVGKKYPTKIPDLLAGLSSELGFTFIDLSDAFEKSSDSNLYLPYDGHWSAKGHTIAAEGLYNQLIENFYDSLF